jgi:tetratricopeptide (TPR) repeat protein
VGSIISPDEIRTEEPTPSANGPDRAFFAQSGELLDITQGLCPSGSAGHLWKADMSFIRRLVGLLVLVTLLWQTDSSVAFAADGKKSTVTNVDSIRRFMEKGQSLFLGGQHLRAAEVFDAGFELHPYSAFLFNAGVALEKAGKLEEAIEHFKKYLEVDPKAPDKADVEKRIERVTLAIEEQKRAPKAAAPAPVIEEATKSLVIIETEPSLAPVRVFRRMIGDAPYDPERSNAEWVRVLDGPSPMNASLDVGSYHVVVDEFDDNNRGDADFEVLAGHVLQVKVNLSQGQFMAHLRITSNVEHARVYLDDPKLAKAPWGKTPFGDFLPAGDHVLAVAATGYETVKRRLTLARAEQQELRIELQRKPVGNLRVSSNVGDTAVVVDGKPVGRIIDGKPPLEISDLPAGKHTLRLTARGRKPLDAEVEIPKGQALPVAAHLVVVPPRGAAWTQAILSGVVLGGGIYLGLESNRLYDEMARDRRDGSLANDDSRKLRGKVFAIGADVAFLGSAVLGGLATYNFLSDPLPPSRLVVGRPVELDTPNRPLRPASTPTKSATSTSPATLNASTCLRTESSL